ncbi:MAG: ABC transporter permease subunit [Peptococcaceae bacterium]|jgi:phosphate transport system permease protein|nr:ABC transporter permease subunit [Peptococcaceae bacterium]
MNGMTETTEATEATEARYMADMADMTDMTDMTETTWLPTAPQAMATRERHRRLSAVAGPVYAWLTTAIIVAVCLLILFTVLIMGAGAISPEFFLREPSASSLNAGDSGGISSPLAGTVCLTLIGIAIAFPISLATAIYMTYYAKKGLVGRGIDLAVDILAGVPTVVIALFALAVFTNPAFTFLSTPVQNDGGVVARAYGKSFLVAGIAMAVMILPFVTKSMAEALKRTPAAYIDGSLALGATMWRTICRVVIPSARRGIVTGAILGMGRIMGDTAIVWLALGGTLRMTGPQPWYAPVNWLGTLRNTGSTLTSYIYYTSPAGEGNNLKAAFGAALVLIVMIILLNALTAVLGGIGDTEGGGGA